MKVDFPLSNSNEEMIPETTDFMSVVVQRQPTRHSAKVSGALARRSFIEDAQ